MKRVAVVGMPNTGKSTLFNRLTGGSARVGNWPGVTVDLLSARAIVGAGAVELVDLPGIYSLHGFSDDEQVVRHFLEHTDLHLVVLVANAVQLDRQLALVLQLRELGLPLVVVLNMADEARRRGIHIERGLLATELGAPVVLASAKHGEGMGALMRALQEALEGARPRRANPRVFAPDDAVETRLEGLLERTVHVPVVAGETVTGFLDRWLLHGWLGLPLFLALMYLLFEAVYTLGTPLQDGVGSLLGWLRGALLEPAVAGMPALLQSFLLDGVYDGVGTVATFLPLIVLFFFFLGFVEDSGYLARAAFLMDAFMARLGLDGRVFVMQLMGFGCNVPALMGTRVMRSRGLRLRSMLMVPFSLCSARLQVFVFITAAVFTADRAPLVLLSLYLLSLAGAFLTALVFSGRYRGHEPLLLELPPYRLPSPGLMWRRGWHESMHFLRRASVFILLGVVLVWVLTHLPPGADPAGLDTLAGRLAQWLAPVFAPLGIDHLLTIALLFGFVAKEVVIGAMAVIYGAGEASLQGIVAARVDWVQAYSFMVFVLFYTPCLSTVAVLRQESRDWGFTALSLAWPLALAWVLSFAFYQGVRLLTGA